MCVSRFDHLVIASQSLKSGGDWLLEKTGVRPAAGGKHPHMGTHNLLSQFSENAFLEVIAIDPEAPTPGHPRWFSLDEPAMQLRLKQQSTPITWVVHTNDLHAAVDKAKAAGVDPGTIIEGARGDLRWLICVRDDGQLMHQGAFPILMQWPEGEHPAARMQDDGLKLKKLIVRSAQEQQLSVALAAIGALELVEVEALNAGQPIISALLGCARGDVPV